MEEQLHDCWEREYPWMRFCSCQSQLQNCFPFHCCTLKPKEWDKKDLAPLCPSSLRPGVLWSVSCFSFPVLLRSVTALEVGETPDTIRFWCQELKPISSGCFYVLRTFRTFSSVLSAGLTVEKEFLSRWGKPVFSIWSYILLKGVSLLCLLDQIVFASFLEY